MNRIWETIKDASSVLFSIVFHVSTKRTDKVIGAGNDEYKELIGKRAVVVEDVSSVNGRVKYSGSYWRAKLSDCSESKIIEAGQSVVIEKCEGNILVVL